MLGNSASESLLKEDTDINDLPLFSVSMGW